MNMMGSSIQLFLLEKHAGCACAYIKKLTNFQNKNSGNSQIPKKLLRNREILLPTRSLRNKAKNSLIKQYHQHTHCIIINQTAVVAHVAQSSSSYLRIKKNGH